MDDEYFRTRPDGEREYTTKKELSKKLFGITEEERNFRKRLGDTDEEIDESIRIDFERYLSSLFRSKTNEYNNNFNRILQYYVKGIIDINTVKNRIDKYNSDQAIKLWILIEFGLISPELYSARNEELQQEKRNADEKWLNWANDVKVTNERKESERDEKSSQQEQAPEPVILPNLDFITDKKHREMITELIKKKRLLSTPQNNKFEIGHRCRKSTVKYVMTELKTTNKDYIMSFFMKYIVLNDKNSEEDIDTCIRQLKKYIKK